MATTAVWSELDGAVRRIVLCRPARRNAFDAALIADLTAAFREAHAGGARCVVLSAEGSAFSAGADLEWMRAGLALGEHGNREDALRLADLFGAIAGCPLPVVARVHGPALGGGAGLACAADVTVMGDGASIGFPEVRLGIVPAVISPYVVQRAGAGAARRLFLTGRAIGAAEALRLGLVDEVAADDALDAAVDGVVADLLRGGPGALAAVKALLDAVAGRAPGEVREETARRIATIRAGEEAQDGLRAFLEREPAPWVPSPPPDAS
jgi:methylglutaconyl-CoA hydratase